jgi:hypothetical protein
VKLLRTPACLTTASIVAILLLYFSLVADQSFSLLRADDGLSRAMGLALIAFPAICVVWIVRGWRLGTTVLRMSNVLDGEGRLPIHDGTTLSDGRLTDDAAEAVFEVARRAVEDRPDDWRTWFHVAYAYEASGNRAMARRALRHGARLFRADQG